MIVALDLDDTLYDEATFVDSGLGAVAGLLAPTLAVCADAVHDRLRRLLAEHGIDDARLVAECVTTYRTHVPDIDLLPGVRAMLTELAAVVPLYLVTDGDPGVQQRKIDALGIEPYFAAVYRTWAFGVDAGKPSLRCFELIREREGVPWAQVAYVGDDPSKDFVSLNRVGSTTVRVHRGRCADVVAEPGFDARLHVGDVTQAPAALGLAR